MQEIEALIEQKKWKQAEARLYRELSLAPTDHWVWYTLSLTHYEQREYELAVNCSRRAVELKANCPLALWHYAGSLYMNAQESEALAIWTILLSLDLDEVAHGECSEGMDQALRLMNDVHYRMGRCYEHLGRHDLASESFEKYLHNRAHGVASTYDEGPVRAYLSKQHVAK